MPNHVHLLIYPVPETYDISSILQRIKGRISTRYRKMIIKHAPEQFDSFCIKSKGRNVFRIWQPGGGFDRNLWSNKAIRDAINYIEGNPVRAGFVETPEAWEWSSANPRYSDNGLVSDPDEVPM